jgi:hypothetical protein
MPEEGGFVWWKRGLGLGQCGRLLWAAAGRLGSLPPNRLTQTGSTRKAAD